MHRLEIQLAVSGDLFTDCIEALKKNFWFLKEESIVGDTVTFSIMEEEVFTVEEVLNDMPFMIEDFLVDEEYDYHSIELTADMSKGN